MNITEAEELLQREPYRTIWDMAQRHQRGELRSVLFLPMRSGMTLYRQAVAAWMAFHRPQHGRPLANVLRRRRIRRQHRANVQRRGW